jgi:hypothetical protein
MNRSLRANRGIAYVSVFLGSTAALILIGLVFGNSEFIRYGYPYLLLVLVTSFSFLLGAGEHQAPVDLMLGGGTLWTGRVLLVLVLVGGLYQIPRLPTTARVVLDTISGNTWNPDTELSNYLRLQAKISAGQRFLAFLPHAHLLDFGRNPINVMDSNCAISPPPGIPLGRGSEAVASYLRAEGIRWIAASERSWTPAGETRDPEAIRTWSESFAGKSQWDRSVVFSHYRVAACIKELSSSYRTSRCEGNLIAINLDRPRVVQANGL